MASRHHTTAPPHSLWASIPQWLRHKLYKRHIRTILYKVRNLVLPGCQQVTLHELLHFFSAGISNGLLWQRAKGMSYSFLMALPPLLIFFFSLIAYFPVDGLQDELLLQLRDIIPDTVFNNIADTVNDIMGHRHSSLLSIGFITAVVLATMGMHGLLMSFNFANKSVETRPILQRIAICLMLVCALFVMITLVLSLFLGYKWLIHYLVVKGYLVRNKINFIIIGVGRWVIMLLFVMLMVSFIYYWAPAKKQRVGFFSVGAFVATAIFMLNSWGSQIYFNNFNRYNLIYGSIGTLLVIMLWIFLNCLVLLVGYEINIAILNGRLSHEAMQRMHLSTAEQVSAAVAGRQANDDEKRYRKLKYKRKKTNNEVK